MGSRPLAPDAPDVAELSSISVLGCCGLAGSAEGDATDLSEALSEAFSDGDAVDEGAAEGEKVVFDEPEFEAGVALLELGEAGLEFGEAGKAPGCGVAFGLAAGAGEGSAAGGVAGAGVGLELGAVAGAVVDEFGIPEADLGSAEGCVWAESAPVEQVNSKMAKNRRRCIGS